MVANPRNPGDVATEEVASAEHGNGSPFPHGSSTPQLYVRGVVATTPNNNKITDSAPEVNSKNKKSEKNSGEYSKGDYAENDAGGPTDAETSADADESTDLKPIEQPEIIKIMRRVLGKSPVVRPKLPGDARGMAVQDKDGGWIEIRLAADLAKMTGNDEIVNEALRVQKMAQDAAAADTRGWEGGPADWADKIFHDLVRMVPMMAKGAALTFAGGTAGKVASAAAMGEQGAGSMFGGVADAGGDLKKASGKAALMGTGYALAEQLQLGWVFKNPAAKQIVTAGLKKRLAHIGKEKLVDWVSEVGTEVLQDVLEDEGVKSALAAQGIDPPDTGSIWERMGTTALETAGPMLVLSLLGFGAGAGTAARQNSQNTRVLVDALSAGYTLKDKKDGKEFSPPEGAAKKDVRNAVRNWAHGRDIEFVPPREQAEERTETPETPADEGGGADIIWDDGDYTDAPQAAESAPTVDETGRGDAGVPTEAKSENTGVSEGDKTIREYNDSTDENLVNFAQNIKSGILGNPSNQNYAIGQVSDRAVADIADLTGIDVSGFKHNISGNVIEHIENRHGENGEADSSMADLNDVGRIKYVLDNYDDVDIALDKDGNADRNTQYNDSNNKPSPTIIYKKRVNGNFYVVEAVPDTKAKKLQLVTAYKNKGGHVPDGTHSTPSAHVQNVHAPASNVAPVNNKITNSAPEVNREDKENKKSEPASLWEAADRVRRGGQLPSWAREQLHKQQNLPAVIPTQAGEKPGQTPQAKAKRPKPQKNYSVQDRIYNGLTKFAAETNSFGISGLMEKQGWKKNEQRIRDWIASEPELFPGVDAQTIDIDDLLYQYKNYNLGDGNKTSPDEDPAITRWNELFREAATKAITDGADGYADFAEYMGQDADAVREDFGSTIRQVPINSLRQKNGAGKTVNKVEFTTAGEKFTARFSNGTWYIVGNQDIRMKRGAMIWVDDAEAIQARRDAYEAGKQGEDAAAEEAARQDYEQSEPDDGEADIILEDEDDADTDNSAPTPKGTVTEDDLEYISSGRDSQTKELVDWYSYKNRSFEARQKNTRAPYRIYETANGGKQAEFLFETADSDAVEPGIADHLNRTRERTKNIPKHKGIDDADQGYYEDVYSVGRGDGAEYDMGGGGDYISGMKKTVKEYQESTDGAMEAFSQQLRKWEAGEMASGDVFDLGTTPKLIQGFGAKDIPLVMTQNVLVKITDGKHNITIEEVARLPEQIADPIMLFRGSKPDSFVALTELKDKSGREVIAAIHLNKEENHMRVNRIASAYGKDWIDNYVENQINADNLLGANKEKASMWYRRRGLQLPKRVRITIDAFNNKIQQLPENVNSKNKKSEKKSGEYSKGDYAESDKSDDAGGTTDAETSANADESTGLKPIEQPEIIKIIRRVLGKSPVVRPKLPGGARGMAVRDKDNNWIEIRLAADLAKSPEQRNKTLSHEAGHVITRPGGDGKLQALFTKITNSLDRARQFIGNDPDAINLTKKDVRRIWWETVRVIHEGEEYINRKITEETPYTPEDILSVWNSTDLKTENKPLEDYIKGLNNAEKKSIALAAMRGEVPEGVPTRKSTKTVSHKTIDKKYREEILKEAEKRRLTELKVIYDELYALSKKWRPFEEGADAKTDKYRQKGEEVFADAISVLFNEPAKLKAEAPNFWRVFHGWEGQQNPFREVYGEIQELIAGGPEALAAQRSTDLRAGFNKGEEIVIEGEKAKEAEEKKENGGLFNKMRQLYQTLVDRDSPLSKLVKDAKKGGAAIADKDNPYLNRRAQRYVKSQQTAYMLDVYNGMQDILGKLDKETVNDINEYLTYTRITSGDRSEIWNPLGFDVKASEQGLAHMKRKLGDERYALLEKAGKQFAELRAEHIVKEIVNSGAFSKEFVDKVVNNKNYATFDVLRRISRMYGPETVKSITGLSALPVGAHGQVGTTQDIRGPFLATMENDMKMLAFIDRNNLNRNTVDLLTQHTNTLGFSAQKQRPNAAGGYDKSENTVFVLRDGKREAYLVSPEIAASMRNPKQAHAAIRATDGVNSIVRDLITQKNPAFWVWNMQRDFRSFHRNIEGNVFRKIGYLAKAYPEIWQYTTGGRMSVDVEEALKTRAMLPSSAYSRDNFFDVDSEFYGQLAKFPTEEQKARYNGRLLNKIMRGLDTINDTMELATKLAGYKMLKADGKMSAEMIAHTVRTRVGTPDIYAGGTATPYTNRFFMFSNVALQGLRESLKVIIEHPGRAALITFYSSVIPVAIMTMAEHGLLSKWFDDDDDSELAKWAKWYEGAMAKIPRFDRVYRGAIPLPIETTSGKQFYIPVPHSELGQTVRGMLYHVINAGFADGGEDIVDEARSTMGDAFGVSPIGLGSLHPALKVGMAAGQYLGGMNPMDYFRNREIIPKNEYRVSTANDAARVGKYMWNNAGGSTFWRIPDDKIDFSNMDWFEMALGMPIVGNPLGRLVRISDKGLAEAEREAKAEKALDKKRAKAKKESQK